MIDAVQKNALAKIVAVYNVKGGVGKTTLTMQAAGAFYGWYKKRVLLIDMDPQTNLSSALIRPYVEKPKRRGIFAANSPEGIRRDPLAALREAKRTLLGILEAIESSTNARPAQIDPGIFTHTIAGADPDAVLRIIPGDPIVYRAASGVTPATAEKLANGFRRFIEGLRKDYDLIFLDMNPAYNELSRVCLLAASHVLSPVRPDAYSLQGIDLLDDISGGLRSEVSALEHLIVLNGGQERDGAVVRSAFQNSRYGDKLMAADLRESRYFFANPAQAETDVKLGMVGLQSNRSSVHARSLDAVVAEMAQRWEVPI